jgi:hypothetical protein
MSSLREQACARAVGFDEAREAEDSRPEGPPLGPCRP